MTWTAFVPPQSESQVRRTLRDDDILFAHSWADLENLVRQHPSTHVLADPTADGSTNVAGFLDLVRRFPSTPVLSCITWSAKGFEAGAELAKYGLKPSVLGFDRSPFNEAAAKWSATALARGILGWAERSLCLFPLPLRMATIDLFERPRRYSTAAELAIAADISLAAVYRSFEPGRGL
jgi:hypothetical protein